MFQPRFGDVLVKDEKILGYLVYMEKQPGKYEANFVYEYSSS